jgi:hypothetical protein
VKNLRPLSQSAPAPCSRVDPSVSRRGSGGPSFVYRKPFWQSAVFGVPADGKRDLPDASLFASNGFWNHAIIFCQMLRVTWSTRKSSGANSPRIENVDGPPGRLTDHPQLKRSYSDIEDASRILDTCGN